MLSYIWKNAELVLSNNHSVMHSSLCIKQSCYIYLYINKSKYYRYNSIDNSHVPISWSRGSHLKYKMTIFGSTSLKKKWLTPIQNNTITTSRWYCVTEQLSIRWLVASRISHRIMHLPSSINLKSTTNEDVKANHYNKRDDFTLIAIN